MSAGSQAPNEGSLQPLQVISVVFDPDTAVLGLRLANGAEYRVTNAGHAVAIRAAVSPGGMLADKQVDWLEKYRVNESLTKNDRLAAGLKALRAELKPRMGR